MHNYLFDFIEVGVDLCCEIRGILSGGYIFVL